MVDGESRNPHVPAGEHVTGSGVLSYALSNPGSIYILVTQFDIARTALAMPLSKNSTESRNLTRILSNLVYLCTKTPKWHIHGQLPHNRRTLEDDQVRLMVVVVVLCVCVWPAVRRSLEQQCDSNTETLGGLLVWLVALVCGPLLVWCGLRCSTLEQQCDSNTEILGGLLVWRDALVWRIACLV
jgi:hypothetical protein